MYRYDNTKGLWGNMQELFRGLTDTSNQTINNKASYDVEHMQMEQAITDMDIANIISEQSITDLDLRVMELEG